MPPKSRSKAQRQPQNLIETLIIEFKRAIKPYIASLKPTLTALVFLLVSSFAQQLLDKLQLNKPCPAPSTLPAQTESQQTSNFGHSIIVNASRYTAVAIAAVSSIESQALELEGQVVQAGSRTLTITRHAAERMIERGISAQSISWAVNSGKLFAYLHANKIVKIGYYNTVSKVFVAVNQQHTKIITVIHNVPAKYISRLINFVSHVNKISKPLSYFGHLSGQAGERFVVLYLFLLAVPATLYIFIKNSVKLEQKLGESLT